MLVIEIDPTGRNISTVFVRASSEGDEDVDLAAWRKIRGFVDQIDTVLREAPSDNGQARQTGRDA